MRPVRFLSVLPLSSALVLLFAGLTLAQTVPAPTAPPPTLVQTIPAVPPGAAPAVSATPATPGASVMSKEAVLARGRQLVEWFYAQNLDPVWAAFQPTARADFGDDLAAFKAYRANGVTTYGKETRLLSEEVQDEDGVTYYLRSATFERGPKVVWTLAFGLDALGRVVSFGILGGTEAAPAQQARSGAPLRL